MTTRGESSPQDGSAGGVSLLSLWSWSVHRLFRRPGQRFQLCSGGWPRVRSTWHRSAWCAGMSSESLTMWPRTEFRRRFYHAMHFSAKRGIAIACRPSICPSVTLVNCDHIGWNSSKIISPLVSLGRSLFAAPTWRVSFSKGNSPKFGPKPPCRFERRRHSIANCGRMVYR